MPELLGDIALHHPSRLSDEELNFLSGIATGRMSAQAPRFASWLAGFAEFEIARREVGAIADPVEPRLPKLDCGSWTASQMASACVASYLALTACRQLPDKSQAAHLLHRAHFALVVWLESRLEN